MLDVQYTLGGVPTILIPLELLDGSGMCNTELSIIAGNGGRASALSGASISRQFSFFHLFFAVTSAFSLLFVNFG